jgi:hypothetical protein
MRSLTIEIGGETKDDLIRQTAQALDSRQASSGNSYTAEEVQRVSSVTRKLVSQGTDLPIDLLESIRAAATLANSDLRPNPDFSSHRPIIGWIIVAVKKLTWPLIRFHLHRHFDNQSELNRRLLYTQVKLFEAARKSTS